MQIRINQLKLSSKSDEIIAFSKIDQRTHSQTNFTLKALGDKFWVVFENTKMLLTTFITLVILAFISLNQMGVNCSTTYEGNVYRFVYQTEVGSAEDSVVGFAFKAQNQKQYFIETLYK
ncbi:Hypothetical_protein [Hexamita inflata]|uniref:Hypothetical_protein n=1 Tax=Hexamita inflata TaxID=28002 RepID=A0AA86TLD5_9EUKA|nr:Hypothetical protein HINF_LOCUS9749 [Hexamita inflata]